MRLISCLMAGVIVLTGPAHAGDPQPKTEKEKLICKRDRERSFGSNFIGRRECRTAQEWKDMEANAKRQLQAFKDNQTDPGKSGGR